MPADVENRPVNLGLQSVRVLPETDGSVHLVSQNSPLQEVSRVTYRALHPGDFDSLRKAHFEMFPVDYEDAFFERVVYRQDGLESLAAVTRDADGSEQLIGFVTTRAFHLYECDPVDRALLGLGHKLLDNETIFYILTLGVASTFRKRGIASELIRWVVDHAKTVRCRAVYLHVIAYNTAAIGLYRRSLFMEAACRENFYILRTGRQPNLEQDAYDAFLYSYIIDTSISMTPFKLLVLALTPLRSLLQSLLSCLPWRESRGTYFGGGELPSLRKAKPSGESATQQRRDITPWLLSLFSKKRALR